MHLTRLAIGAQDYGRAATVTRLSRPPFPSSDHWLELSIPTLSTEADWRAVAAHITSMICKAETMKIEGKPLSPAFVVITNHTFLANEDIAGEPGFALLETLHIPDYPFGRTMEIEDALEGYDKHRDVVWMMKALHFGANDPDHLRWYAAGVAIARRATAKDDSDWRHASGP